MRAGLVLVAGLFALAAPMSVCASEVSAPPQAARTACAGEPGAGIDLRARLVNLIDSGPTARAIIDLAVRADVNLPAGRIHGRLRRVTDDGMVLDLSQRAVSIPRGTRIFLRYDLDLSPGEDYQLTFTLADPDRPDGRPLSSTTVNINLDPARKPQALETRLQYQARMQGR